MKYLQPRRQRLILIFISIVYFNIKLVYSDEIIKYNIIKFGMKVGSATLEFHEKEKLDDKEVCLILFTATALNFFDEERIFIDPKTFYPIQIKRDLNIWGNKEKIIETYLKSGKISIVKEDCKGNISKQIIDKGTMTDNIYGVIYRYREQGAFEIGEEFKVNLPTKDINIKLIQEITISIGGKRYQSYYLTSKPKQYFLWFDTSKDKIPLRIDGAVGLKKTSMRMISYQKINK